MSTWATAVTCPLVTVHADAARAVTETAFDCRGAALAATMLAWLVATVPAAVPGGKWTVMASCAVVPAGRGVKRVKRAVPVAAL